MNEHVSQETPRLSPSMWIVYEQLCDRASRVRFVMGSIVAEQDDFDQRDQNHGERWRPACVFLFVGAVCTCVSEDRIMLMSCTGWYNVTQEGYSGIGKEVEGN